MSKNWPALIIGAIVAVYWVRVMIMALRAPKVSGHKANVVPPEKLGRILRIVWIPAVLLWIILPFAAFIVTWPDRYGELRPILQVHRNWLWLPWWTRWVAAAVALACLLATFVCWKRMGRSWRMGIDPNDKTQLIFEGPFAYVRHPIYGLSSLLMLATMVAVPSVLMWIAGGIHLILLQWEARREERHLEWLHGDEYRGYARATGRFFPKSLRAYSSDRDSNSS
jgi:protein-S-isoprenylcysteine O-methyltransferase Ste14